MAGEWGKTSLADLIDIRHGFAFKGAFISEEECGDVLLTPGNFAIGGGFKDDKFKYYHGSYPEEFVLSGGDLLVTMTDLSKQADALGYPAFVPTCPEGRHYLHNQRLGKVVIKDKGSLNARYLYYVLCSEEYRHEVLASATGTTVKHTSPERIKRFRFHLPSPSEQRAIAHVLGTLDDKIELNRRMNETLEAMARALFKSWFVDFDPVRAKMSDRDPGLPKHLADLFPDRLVDSELGPVPEGWEVGCFGDIVEQMRDKENPPASPDAVFHHFSIPAFDEDQWPKVERGENIKSQKSRVPPGTVLLSKLNPEIERVWLVDIDESDQAVCSTEFLVLRSRPPYGKSFAYCLGRSPAFLQKMGSLVTGTSKSHQRAQADAVLELPVVLCPKPLAELFERRVAVFLQMTQVNRRQSRTLAAQRDALLPQLVLGNVRVPSD